MSNIDTTDSKPWWTSTTIQGAAVTALSTAEPLITKLLGVDLGDPAKIISAVFTVVGLIMVLVGRAKATKAIH